MSEGLSDGLTEGVSEGLSDGLVEGAANGDAVIGASVWQLLGRVFEVAILTSNMLENDCLISAEVSLNIFRGKRAPKSIFMTVVASKKY